VGSNENGELGAPSTNTCTDAYGNFPCSLTPVQVQGPGGTGFLTGVIAVAAGDHHSLALKSDGSAWAWGYNAWGQLGSHGNTSSTAPEQVQSPDGTGFLTGVSAIAARGYFSLALKSDNTVWAWGANNNGELGNGTLGSRTLPSQVLGPGGTGFWRAPRQSAPITMAAWRSRVMAACGPGVRTTLARPVPGRWATTRHRSRWLVRAAAARSAE
jgi:hypothetical protein